MCRFYDFTLYTEYFNKRGLDYNDLFYKYNIFENIPIILYFLIFFIDGCIYYAIEIVISKISIYKIKNLIKSKKFVDEEVRIF